MSHGLRGKVLQPVQGRCELSVSGGRGLQPLGGRAESGSACHTDCGTKYCNRQFKGDVSCVGHRYRGGRLQLLQEWLDVVHHATQAFSVILASSAAAGRGILPKSLSDGTCDLTALLCCCYPVQTVYEVRYKLPDGFTCEHCVLQWHWLAGHNCW